MRHQERRDASITRHPRRWRTCDRLTRRRPAGDDPVPRIEPRSAARDTRRVRPVLLRERIGDTADDGWTVMPGRSGQIDHRQRPALRPVSRSARRRVGSRRRGIPSRSWLIGVTSGSCSFISCKSPIAFPKASLTVKLVDPGGAARSISARWAACQRRVAVPTRRSRQGPVIAPPSRGIKPRSRSPSNTESRHRRNWRLDNPARPGTAPYCHDQPLVVEDQLTDLSRGKPRTDRQNPLIHTGEPTDSQPAWQRGSERESARFFALVAQSM